MIGFLVFVCVVVLVLINVPIAVALCIASVAAMLATQGVASLPNVPLALYQGATSFPLIAIPLFILAAAIMNTSGISHRLIDFCQALVGWVRGALAQVNVLSHMFFAEISGSAVAGVAATASIIMPAMKKRGYPGPFTAAVTSSTATLAIIIPPSIPMILYAVMAGTSVVQMFVAGIVPGLLAAFGFMGLCYLYAVRYNWPGRGDLRAGQALARLQACVLGADAADHHPRRHLRRHCHGDRGCGAGRRRGSIGGRAGLSRAQLGPTARSDHRWHGTDWYRDAAGCARLLYSAFT